MRIFFSINPLRGDDYWVIDNDIIINLYFLCIEDTRAAEKKLNKTLTAIYQTLAPTQLITCHTPLNDDIQNHLPLLAKQPLSFYDNLNLILSCAIRFFVKKGLAKISFIQSKNFKKINFQSNPQLCVRYGIVELRVIHSFLFEQPLLFDALTQIKTKLDDEAFMYDSALKPSQ